MSYLFSNPCLKICIGQNRKQDASGAGARKESFWNGLICQVYGEKDPVTGAGWERHQVMAFTELLVEVLSSNCHGNLEGEERQVPPSTQSMLRKLESPWKHLGFKKVQ